VRLTICVLFLRLLTESLAYRPSDDKSAKENLRRPVRTQEIGTWSGMQDSSAHVRLDARHRRLLGESVMPLLGHCPGDNDSAHIIPSHLSCFSYSWGSAQVTNSRHPMQVNAERVDRCELGGNAVQRRMAQQRLGCCTGDATWPRPHLTLCSRALG
jgi:hypothetical protein